MTGVGDSSLAQRGSAGGGTPETSPTLEQQLLGTLRKAETAIAGAQLHEAAELMQTANTLCEAALRDPSSVSRSGLIEIQRLFAICLQAGGPLQDKLVKQMADTGTTDKARLAYQPRRRQR